MSNPYKTFVEARLEAVGLSNPFEGMLPAPDNIQDTDISSVVENTHLPILEEIHTQRAFLRQIQKGLQDGITEKNKESIKRLIKRCLFTIEESLDGEVHDEDIDLIKGVVSNALTDHLSQSSLSVDDAKALRAASKDVVSMLKQYRDMAAGMKVYVDCNDARLERLCSIMFKRCDKNQLELIAQDLEKFAPALGITFKIDI